MPQLIFFALVGAVAYVGYKSFVREANRVTAKVRRNEKQAANGANGTLVKDPEDRRIPACQGLEPGPSQAKWMLLEGQHRPLAVAAPGKINLALHVVGRRDDGYHLLESLAVFTRFGDRLTVEPRRVGPFSRPARSPATCRSTTAIWSSRPATGCAPPSRSPTARRSRSGWKRTCRSPRASAADRAMRRRRCAALTSLGAWRLPTSELARLGLGARRRRADVPCRAAADRHGHRRQDRASFADFPALHLVLVNPGVPVATPAVFRALGTRDNPGLPPLPAGCRLDRLVDGSAAPATISKPPAQGDRAGNRRRACTTLDQAGARFARMSGSGATCFGLFEDAAQAARRAASNPPPAARLVRRGDAKRRSGRRWRVLTKAARSSRSASRC